MTSVIRSVTASCGFAYLPDGTPMLTIWNSGDVLPEQVEFIKRWVARNDARATTSATTSQRRDECGDSWMKTNEPEIAMAMKALDRYAGD